MNTISEDSKNIIYDYKSQLDHNEKYKECMKVIDGLSYHSEICDEFITFIYKNDIDDSRRYTKSHKNYIGCSRRIVICQFCFNFTDDDYFYIAEYLITSPICKCWYDNNAEHNRIVEIKNSKARVIWNIDGDIVRDEWLYCSFIKYSKLYNNINEIIYVNDKGILYDCYDLVTKLAYKNNNRFSKPFTRFDNHYDEGRIDFKH